MLISLGCALALSLVTSDAPEAADNSRKAYDQLRAAAGRDPESQVRLALWCESHGLQAERVKHLSIAILADPSHATARGLLGLVEHHGKWAKPQAVADKLKADETASRSLLEYNARRDKLRDSPKEHYELALWCEEKGLKTEATVHFMNVTRLDPSHELAWKHLGCKKYNGAWMSEDQIASVKAETEAQKAADKHWRPILERAKSRLAEKRNRASVEEKLAAITDPRALRSIWAVFAMDVPASQDIAVRLLGQIEGAASTNSLAVLAVKGGSPEVRRHAAETLKRRDPREYVDTLINFLNKPLKYEVRPVGGPGSPGILFVEGEQYNVRRVYNPPDGTVPVPAPTGRGNLTGVMMITEQNRQVTNANTAIAQDALARDVAQMAAINEEITRANGDSLSLLESVTGQKFGADQKAWRGWWTDQKGYAFITPEEPSIKPTLDQFVPIQGIQGRGYDCFAGKTPVRTLEGLKPIETVRVGDQVLTQDAKTGSLQFRPVVTAFHYPPAPTLRVQFDSEEVVATGIHRFWKAGKGWVMARELKPGDDVRTVGGMSRVVSVSADKVQPVYNLEILGRADYFVGRDDKLVHDHSLVEPTTAPFDAPTKPSSAAATK
jgi:hypothetical protein